MDEAVKHIRNNEKWRREYMRFAEIEKERFDEGVEVARHVENYVEQMLSLSYVKSWGWKRKI